MSLYIWQRVSAAIVGVVGIAAISAIATRPAQAASLDYTTTVRLFANSLPSSPLSAGVFNFTKTDVAPQLVDYTLNSATFNLNPLLATPLGLQTSYTRSSLSSSAPAQALASVFIGLLPPQYTKYSGLLTSFLTPNAPVTYRGNGDFPPADFSYAFPVQTLPNSIRGVSPTTLLALQSVFATGGRITFSTLPQVSPVVPLEPPVELPITPAAAVPEPTTMAGLALASAGMAIVRRKRQPKDVA